MSETDRLPESSHGPVDLRPLRALVHAIAIALLIVTSTLFLFLYRQTAVLRRQAQDLSVIVVDYQRSNVEQFINEFGTALNEFSQANPDFQPIYLRYFGTNTPPPSASTNSPPSR